MSNVFFGTGNVGTSPEMRFVQVGNRTAKVMEVRVFFDAYRKDEAGEFQQDEAASFWKSVVLWDDRAERAAKILRKGARVCVSGQIKGERWTDKNTGEPRKGDHVEADDIYLSLARVESVQWRERAEQGASEETTGA